MNLYGMMMSTMPVKIGKERTLRMPFCRTALATTFNYKTALAYLGKKNRKKLCNNTYLVRRGIEGRTEVAVQLHSTDVITFKPNGDTVLCSGGWDTKTTWDRINSFQKYRVWSNRGQRVIRGNDDLEYLFHFDGAYYYRGHSIMIKADGTISGKPYYAEALQKVSGKKCETKNQMLAIIKNLDRDTVEKFMQHITIDTDILGMLCLTIYTGKNTLKESLASLNPKQLWMVWRRGSWEMKEKVEPYLIPLLSKIDFDFAWKIWWRTSNRDTFTEKLLPRLIRELPTIPLEKIERIWSKTKSYRSKELIAKYCTKDLLPLILHDKTKRYRWSTSNEINDIVASRLKEAA